MGKRKVEKELEVKEKDLKSEVHQKKLDNLVNEMVDQIVGENQKEKVFTNIKKLKCDYTTYKEERTKYNMPVEEACAKCGKRFEAGEEIYTAFEKEKQDSCIICANCVK